MSQELNVPVQNIKSFVLGGHGDSMVAMLGATEVDGKKISELLKKGNAYKCYCSNEEIEEQKTRAKQKKIPYIYDRKWRDKNESEAPKNIKPVIRFKSKIDGKSKLKDLVQGDVEIDNNTIEDFVILRNDGTPTYNLSVTVDDHDMKVTHIIRGDDHKINTFKQIQIYEAMNWDLPEFAHIPLIHTKEGKKLSKRDKDSTPVSYTHLTLPTTPYV